LRGASTAAADPGPGPGKAFAMQTSAIGYDAQTVSSASATGLSGLQSEDFFRILVSELKQQDPFEPAKTADMISQVSQIRTIELSGQLTQTLEQMTLQQRMMGTSELIGKYVLATVGGADGSVTTVEGVVTGVRFNTDGTAVLELDTGQSVLANDVAWVTTLDALEALATQDESALQTVAAADDAKADAVEKRQSATQEPATLTLDAALQV